MATYQRLLNPVYNHLDNGNPAKALKECDQILRKQSKKSALPKNDPIWQNTNSLKAIALQRLNRTDEALELANQIRETEPSDETTLQMVSNIYRDCHKPQFIPTLYENALKKQESEDLYTHTFMAYLRNENFMQMKLTGAKLFQKYKQYPYLYWSAMAGYLQGVLNQPEMKKMNLTLSRRYIEKELDKVDNERQIKLYLMILEELEDYAEIENVLKKYESLFTQTLFGYKEQLLAVWERKQLYINVANEMVKNINDDDNDWKAWKKLISTIFTISKNDIQIESSEKSMVKSIPDLIQFVSDKCVSCRSRAPHLSKFEIIKYLNGVPENWGNIEDVFIHYCQKFRSKSSTYFDIEPYFELLREKEEIKNNIINQLVESFEPITNFENENLEAICCNHLLPYQLWLNWTKDKEVEISELINFALNIIDETKTLNSINRLMPTEPRPWDRHFLVAAQFVLSQNLDQNSIIKSLAILEVGIENTGKNSDLMLMALNLYAKVDCVSKGIDCMKNLDIKSIQFDSIGYLAFPQFARLNPESCMEVMNNAMTFYLHSNKDATDMIIKCYQNGNFDKILDMMKFRDAILNSTMRRLTLTEYQILSFTISDSVPLELFPENSSDNRDLDALNIFTSNRAERCKEVKTESASRNDQWLKYRECQLVLMTQLADNDIMLNATIIDQKLSELSVLGSSLFTSDVKLTRDENTLRTLIGIHDPVNLPDEAGLKILELIQASLAASYKIKKVLLAEKGNVGETLNNFKLLIFDIVEILKKFDKNFYVRWFVAEGVMVFERTVRSATAKVKALRRKNVNKLNKNIKDVFVQITDVWDALKALESIYTETDETVDLGNLNLAENLDKLNEMIEKVGKTVQSEHAATWRQQSEFIRKTMISLENILLKK